jgi:anti-sigma factor ChrR (cupin superfamily)
MSPALETNPCGEAERVCAYALRALASSDVPEVEAHISSCPECRRELETLRPIIDAFVSWPRDVLRPPASLQERLAQRISIETGRAPVSPVTRQWSEPEWEEVAPGISCKLLATDTETHRVSMLVRLAPGVHYPPHRHAGVEELHLLDGELWIDDRKLYPGDYQRGEPGSGDQRVWSETGCTCVLMTSTRDVLSAS